MWRQQASGGDGGLRGAIVDDVCGGSVLLGAALLLLALAPLELAEALGGCHNQCRQRGLCIVNGTVNNRCQCDNFSVGAAFTGVDCRYKSCPTGPAWADFATANDAAHAPATCSNKGHCTESTGECVCATGWTGPACQRTQCPGSGSSLSNPNETICSGHGKCLSMREMAATKDGVRLFTATTYNLWDADMIRGCICDEGYRGYDCSQRECIKGDDPLTAGVDEVQILECTCLATCSGSFRLQFRGAWTAAIPYSATAERLKYELEQLETVRGVSVTLHGAAAAPNAFVCDADGVSAAVTFTHVPGNLPDLVFDKTALASTSGTPPTMSVVTTGNGAQGGTCVTGTKENVECNNRGYCDRATGYCTCHPNFASSDGAGAAGSTGDCGFQAVTATNCAGDLVATTAVTEVCNSRGSCSGATGFTCTCNSGYEGPTCEYKSCPTGVAWFDEATTTDTAHTTTVTCSNRGTCDGATGSCTCQDGFDGTACETFKCPGSSSCGGTTQGTCYTMSELATVSELNGNLRGVTYTHAAGTATWDANKIKGCDCKIYHHGPFPVLSDFDAFDCSLRKCPTGDDPSTTEGAHEVQTLKCTATSGTFTLTFRQITSTAFNYNDNAATFKTTFLEILQREVPTGAPPYAFAPADVTVTFTDSTGSASSVACDANGVDIAITFLTHLGDLPPITADVTSLQSGAGTIVITETAAGTYENVECGRQGVCDRKKGVCECMPGFDSSDGSGQPGLRGDCAHQLEYPNVYDT
eukprot:g3939.t1